MATTNSSPLHLNNFISRLKEVGLQSASHYYISVGGNGSDPTDKDVLMMIDSINVPGLQIMSSDFRTYGEMRDVPYGVSYPTLNLSIILDNTMVGKKWFDLWSNQVYDRKTRTPGYYDDFIKTITIYMEDVEGGITYITKVNECWPKTINDIQLSYTDHETVRLNVTCAFKNWETIEAQRGNYTASKVSTAVQDNKVLLADLFKAAMSKNVTTSIDKKTIDAKNDAALKLLWKKMKDKQDKTDASYKPWEWEDESSVWEDTVTFFSDLKLPLVKRGGIYVPLSIAYQLDLLSSQAIALRQAHPPLYDEPLTL